MDIAILERIGLSQSEAKIYLALLKLKHALAGTISKESQLNRTTTYDSLERLIEKGLVSYVVEANRKIFRPASPSRIKDKLKEQEEAAEEIIPELKRIFEHEEEKEEAEIYRGRKGIRSILNEMLGFKHYVAFGSSGRFLEIMKHDFELFQKRKKELKINARVILAEKDKRTEQVKIAFSLFKYIPDKVSALTTTFVYGKNIAIIVWGETPIATIIRSSEVADSYRNYFEMLWKIAKR
jgi:sugar-specific transcriptional regulator TrmB